MLDQLYILPILLFSVVIHELAHGWVAFRLGDPTARDLGRLTLNPLPHIDPVGSVLVPLVSLAISGRVFIAWAKPVPVNPLNFLHLRRDDILVSIAGPLSNILVAGCCTGAVILLGLFAPSLSTINPLVDRGMAFLVRMFFGGISLNIVLAVFNMVPIPPLDGSHVLASILPPRMSLGYRKIGFVGIFAVILLMRWQPFVRVFVSVIDFCTYPFEYLIHRAL